MVADAVHFLIILVSLADDRYHVSGSGVDHTVGDRFPPVRNLNELTACLFDRGTDIRNDIPCLLESGIVGRQYGKISQSPGAVAHGIPSVLRAVSPASKHADKSFRVILTQCLQKAFHTDCIVGVVDDYRAFLR